MVLSKLGQRNGHGGGRRAGGRGRGGGRARGGGRGRGRLPKPWQLKASLCATGGRAQKCELPPDNFLHKNIYVDPLGSTARGVDSSVYVPLMA